MPSAICAAINNIGSFNAMPNHPATAMCTLWGQSVNGALEAVELMFRALKTDRKTLVIVIPAYFALRHISLRAF
jgi:hypothetical protein